MRNQTHREITRLMTQMRRLCSLTINKRLAAVGCTLHEYAVLFRLVHDAEVPQYELAYDAAIDPAAASRLVRTMVRAGLVTTHVAPADKRQRFVKVTAKGRALERTLSPVVDAALDPLLAGLTTAEHAQFLSLLRKAYEYAASASDGVEAEEARAATRPAKADKPVAVAVRRAVPAKRMPRGRSA
jgi:DNA-binding MarR family transcriptional regulator